MITCSLTSRDQLEPTGARQLLLTLALCLSVQLTLSYPTRSALADPAPTPAEPQPAPLPPKELNKEPTPKPAIDPALLERVIQGVQSFYATAQDFKADFRQTFTYKIYQRKKISTGKVFFKKPALMRWDYEAPHERLFIADGSILWVYEPEEAQVFKRPLASAQLPVALRFMKGEGRLTDDFKVASLSKNERAYQLTLHPKTPSSEYRELQLIVDPDQFNVTASVLIDPVGNSNHIAFADAKVNSDLPIEGFSFTPPAGVRVIGD